MTQFILSDNEKNNIFDLEMHELQNYFSSKKSLDFQKQPEKVLGVLSDTLKSTYMFLYDNELLMQKYPEGIVTENLLLLPVNKYEQLRKDFSDIHQEKYSNNFKNWAEFLIMPLVKNLELKLDMTIPENEVSLLSQEISSKMKYDKKSTENTPEFNFTVIKNKDLLDNIKNQDLTLQSFIEKSLSLEKEEATYVQYWLKKNSELLENLPSVADKIEHISPVTSVNITELKDNLRSEYPGSSSFKNIYQICQIVDNMKAETCNDKKAFIENSSTTLVPVLALTDDFTFSVAVQYIKENIFSENNVKNNSVAQKNPNSVLISDFCKELIHACTNTKREIMINSMTEFNLFTSLILSGDELVKEQLANQKLVNQEVVKEEEVKKEELVHPDNNSKTNKNRFKKLL